MRVSIKCSFGKKSPAHEKAAIAKAALRADAIAAFSPCRQLLFQTLLVGDSAGSLAGGLAGSLALAAALPHGLQASGLNGFDMLHLKPHRTSAKPVNPCYYT
jgi:hypothetical protein